MRGNRAPIREGIIEPASVGTNEARALETVGRLTRGALHELSNPLVGLLGSAELALAEAESGTKLHERILLIQQTAGELAGIVRALQAFLRAQHDPPRRLSLGQAARAAVDLVELVSPASDITISAAGDAEVVAAPGVVARELVELLVEALEHASDGSTIELLVGVAGDEGVAAVAGAGELRLPLA
jgi:two-component system, OmpR family, heavy metal sensor histidine kinase CusS